jgi:hypothetical protein
VHLTWTFDLEPHGSPTPVLSILGLTGFYYLNLTSRLASLLKEKDTHILALQEKLKDLGGSYYARKHKNALEEFNVSEWREQQRQKISMVSGRGVFVQWADVDEETVMDWTALANSLRDWNAELVAFCGT